MNHLIEKTIEKREERSVNIGFENRVISSKIIAIVNPNSSPIKRMIKKAKERNFLINATSGKPTRSVIIMENGHVILSSISPRNLSARLEKNNFI